MGEVVGGSLQFTEALVEDLLYGDMGVVGFVELFGDPFDFFRMIYIPCEEGGHRRGGGCGSVLFVRSFCLVHFLTILSFSD